MCREFPVAMRLVTLHPYTYLGPYIEQYVYWKMRIDPIATFLHPILPKDAEILDLGCGYGQLAHYLHYHAPKRRIFGVDHDESKIQAAQASARNHPALQFEVRDLLEWSPTTTADVVMLIDVLHYWDSKQQDKILERAIHAVGEGGLLVLRDTDLETGRHKLNQRTERFSTWFGFNRGPGPIHFRKFSELRALCEKHGFKTWQVHDPMGETTGNVVLFAMRPVEESSSQERGSQKQARTPA